eukprot:gene15240-biopygen18692
MEDEPGVPPLDGAVCWRSSRERVLELPARCDLSLGARCRLRAAVAGDRAACARCRFSLPARGAVGRGGLNRMAPTPVARPASPHRRPVLADAAGVAGQTEGLLG